MPGAFHRASPPGGHEADGPRQNSPGTAPPPGHPRKNSPSRPKYTNFGVFSARWANFFALAPTIGPRRANKFAHRTQPRGDVETKDTTATADAGQDETAITTARPQTATAETNDTSATEKHAKNTHFSPAKAMTVSTGPPHGPAKVSPVSDNHTPGLRTPAATPARSYKPAPRKLARNSIEPTPQQDPETLKYQRTQFKS